VASRIGLEAAVARADFVLTREGSLLAILDSESVKELSQLRTAIHRAQDPAQRALLRARVPIL
jgi:PHD/YefM family antitoxin component YafN of YafNO toxin-antitoxin module